MLCKKMERKQADSGRSLSLAAAEPPSPSSDGGPRWGLDFIVDWSPLCKHLEETLGWAPQWDAPDAVR